MAILSKVDQDVKEKIIDKIDSERIASSVRLDEMSTSGSCCRGIASRVDFNTHHDNTPPVQVFRKSKR